MVESVLSLQRPEAGTTNQKQRRTSEICDKTPETRMGYQAKHQEKVTATCMLKEGFWLKIKGGKRNRKQETKDLSGQDTLWLCSEGLMRRTQALPSPGGYTDNAKFRANAHKEKTLSLSWKASSSDKGQQDSAPCHLVTAEPQKACQSGSGVQTTESETWGRKEGI